MHIKHKLIKFDWIPHNLIVLLWHSPFFPYKICFQPLPPSPPPPYSMWRACENCLELLWWLSDTSGTPKTQKGNIEIGEKGFVPQFLRVIFWKSKIIFTGVYLSRCFQTFLNKLTNKFHTLHTASTGSPNLERDVIFWFYILTLDCIA